MKRTFKKQVSFTLLAALSLPVVTMAQLTYPESKRGEQVDLYHGSSVADPYRWLEDDNSVETKAWVKRQQAFTRTYLDGISFRGKVRTRLEEMWNYERTGAPFKEGNYYYFYKNNGLQNQSVLIR
jgi:prolyl oligopeptidase